MKKQKIINSYILFIILFYGSSFTQEMQSVQDGMVGPDNSEIYRFTSTDFDDGISKMVIDKTEILLLTPQVGTLMFAPRNGWTLSGINWQYNNADYNPGDAGYIRYATDVDYVRDFFPNADSPVYLITDFAQNKVIIRHVSKKDIPFNPQDGNLSGPADADLYEEGGSKKVLVTYRSTDTIAKIDYDLQNVIWSFGGFGVLSSPSDAEKIESSELVLIADTGNRRVITVSEQTNAITWQYPLDAALTTFNPVDVEAISNSLFLVTDQIGHRIILLDATQDSIVWQYGTGVPGNSFGQLNLPSDADYDNGRIIIADKGNNRIIEVDRSDSNYFYEWPNKVMQVEDVDFGVNDGFLVCQKEIVNQDNFWLPTLLAFSPPSDREGPIASADTTIKNPDGSQREVDFQKVFLYAQEPNSTTIEYQFRTAPLNISIKEDDDWFGPEGIDSKYSYANPADTLLYSGHKPMTSCQFGAHLSTSVVRVTPRIDSVAVVYNSYEILTDEPYPGIYPAPSVVIGTGLDEPVSVVWDSLTLEWEKVEIDQRYIKDMEFRLIIRNARSGETLLTQDFRQTANGKQNINLTNESGLRGAKQITFRIELRTLNSGLTPRLKSWKFSWREFEVGPPRIVFTDSSFVSKPFYTATDSIPSESDSIFVDPVYVRLENVLEAGDAAFVTFSAPGTNDIESDSVYYDEKNQIYKSKNGMPIIILSDSTQSAIPGDNIFHVFDRDSLYAEFQSDQRPGEVLRDTIMVVEGTLGDLFIENALRDTTSVTYVGSSLHLRVTNELDRSLDPILQDSIEVLLQNDMTSDFENVVLYEEPDTTTGNYDTGIFISAESIVLVQESNSKPNDGQLFSRAGDRISAQYPDNFKKWPTYKYVTIPGIVGPFTPTDLVIEVAPNPYKESQHGSFDIRMRSDVAELTATKLEVYNLAGERVMQREGSQIVFDSGGNEITQLGEYGYIRGWWNLLSDGGQHVSSGTYWARVEALVGAQTVSRTVKFVVVR
ncbi:hypothetical protein EH223_18580 [candidate division KSB1 bacterium]|nr:hypothetical protein [candidate division KSB1 bacterium]RQW00490.1 MAG: hypothetical protein EH223_18580 [candidate division KSB1 bacterium]